MEDLTTKLNRQFHIVVYLLGAFLGYL